MDELFDSLTEFFFLCEHVFDEKTVTTSLEQELKAVGLLIDSEKNK